MKGDTLGDRMKTYEGSFKPFLVRRAPVIVRVDGRAFHTYTRNFEKPFDPRLINGMGLAMQFTARQMAGFKLAYTQSDECSFLLTDYDTNDTQAWFGNNLSKIVSITASLFTAYFNEWMFPKMNVKEIASFDARAFTIPEDDVPNYFVWRQRDWTRNSLRMLAQYHFSHKQLDGKDRADMHEMLHSIGVHWGDLDSHLKNGVYLTRDHRLRDDMLLSYDAIKTAIGPLTIPTE